MANKWTRKKYRKMCKEVHEDMVNEGWIEDDCAAYDIAKSLLEENKGLKEFIINELGASDYMGRLASDI